MKYLYSKLYKLYASSLSLVSRSSPTMTDTSACYVQTWTDRPALRDSRWTMWGGGGGIPSWSGGGRTGGLGGIGKGKIPAAGDHWRIRGGQGRKLGGGGGGGGGRRDDIEGVPGRRRKAERVTLGSILLKLERGGARVGTQGRTCTGRGSVLDTGHTTHDGFV